MTQFTSEEDPPKFKMIRESKHAPLYFANAVFKPSNVDKKCIRKDKMCVCDILKNTVYFQKLFMSSPVLCACGGLVTNPKQILHDGS